MVTAVFDTVLARVRIFISFSRVEEYFQKIFKGRVFFNIGVLNTSPVLRLFRGVDERMSLVHGAPKIFPLELRN